MYIAIVTTLSNRVDKHQEFATQGEADAHAVTYGGIVYNNSSNHPIPELWVDGAVVTHDPDTGRLAGAKTRKIKELKAEGLKRMNAVYGDEVFSNPGEVEFLIDIDNTYDRSGPVAPRFVTVNQVLSAFKAARTIVNGLPNVATVDAYDVVNTPAWP